MKVDGKGQARVILPEEEERLLRKCKHPREKLLVLLLIYTGARISECLNIRCEDLRHDGNFPWIRLEKKITKGKKKAREIPVCPTLEDALDEIVGDREEGYLIENLRRLNQPMSRQWGDRVMRRIFREAKIKGASTHSGRRTCLTRLHHAGIPLAVIQRISGHSSLATLQRYLEVSEENLLSAARAMEEARVGVKEFKKQRGSSKTDKIGGKL